MGNLCGRPAKCANASSSPLSSKKLSGSDTSSKRTSAVTTFRSEAPTDNLRAFTLSDLKAAAKNFRSDSFLGEGGFGCVFKGWIDEKTYAPTKPGFGVVVAIKKLKRESFQGHKEWLAEVTYLGQLHHKNLVRLIGYCSESENKLLVYEYMQRGSLENHLFKRGGQPLSWAMRVNIAVDVARGLSFLHGLHNPVIYRDLKASNILLDSDINAKLSDFGLARNGPTGDNTHVSTRVVGTRGYAAPEYVATGHMTLKIDIYSFGVVLLELLSGRRALDEDGGGVSLVEWARPFLNDRRRILRIMDTKLEGQYSKKGATAIAALALQCLHSDPRNRLEMTEILEALEPLQTSKETTMSSRI